MQNDPTVKRKKEEFKKESDPLPSQQSSNRDLQQTKVVMKNNMSLFFIGTQVWDLLHLSLEKAAELWKLDKLETQ